MRYAMPFTAALAIVLAAPSLEAQERPPRRQEPIEIRGTVPTPQVVTVRPRETPAYSRRVLVPTFYDHDFWPSILPAYVLVVERLLQVGTPADTMLRADTLRRLAPPPAARIDTMPLRPDSVRAIPPAQPPVPPPATEERTLSHALEGARGSGTASASSTRRR